MKKIHTILIILLFSILINKKDLIAQNPDSYEPPIQIITVLHIDPEPMNRREAEFRLTREHYDTAKGNILFMMKLARKYGIKMDGMFNGWYMQSVLKYNDYDHIRDFIEEGHSIGTHAHQIIYDEEDDLWKVVRGQEMDYDLLNRIWSDGARFINEVLDKIGISGENKTQCVPWGSKSDQVRLMDEMGFTIASGAESGIEYFGHLSWNPMRVSMKGGRELNMLEGQSSKYVSVPYSPQIGSANDHGKDLRIFNMQRQFILLIAEWFNRENTGAEDKVWVTGGVVHPNYGTAYNDDIEKYYKWLYENFVTKRTLKGNRIAEFATMSGVAERYEEWEKDHPGVSSFSYVEGDPYPYSYESLVKKLGNAEYKRALDIPGAMGHKFTRGIRAVYVLWSQDGERTVDLSGELLGKVHIYDLDGNEQLVPSSAIPLTEEPVLIEQN